MATVQPIVSNQTSATRLNNLTLTKTFTEHSDLVWSVVLSPDGQTLYSGSADHTVKLWSAQNGTLLRTLSDSPDWVLAIAVDSQHLVSGSKDPTIRIWQLH